MKIFFVASLITLIKPIIMVRYTFFFMVISLSISNTINGQTAEDYFNKGLEKYSKNDFAESIQEFNNAIKLNPRFSKAYLNRGLSKFSLQDYRGAIFDYTQVIKIEPQNAEAYNYRGVAQAYINHDLIAIKDYTRAIIINPNFSDAYCNRGQAKIRLNQKESGCLDLSKAGELGMTRAYELIKLLCNH